MNKKLIYNSRCCDVMVGITRPRHKIELTGPSIIIVGWGGQLRGAQGILE
jgi:hypothetical protein